MRQQRWIYFCIALLLLVSTSAPAASAGMQKKTAQSILSDSAIWTSEDVQGLGQTAQGVITPAFRTFIGQAAASKQLEVIITFKQKPVESDIKALKALGITTGVRFQVLPMVAVLALPAQILRIAQWSNVLAISPNQRLQHFNNDARAATQTDRVRMDEQFREWNGNLPVTGKGIGVAVVDTGINAAHPDLRLGKRVKENVKILTGPLNNGLGAGIIPLLTTTTLLNTDTSSGHGTHVAGIVGGSGAASNGQYAGIAPGSDLIGIGIGDAINVIYGLAGFDWVLQNQQRLNIRIVTNSWGATGTDKAYENSDGSLTPIYLATKEMVKRNMVVLFASWDRTPRPAGISLD